MATSYDYPYFKTPCSIIVAGPSQCDKTTFTRRLLRSTSRAFDRPVRRIVYCYGEPQRCFKDMQREGIHFQNYKGIPKNIRTLFPNHLRPGILVLDDLMRDCGKDQYGLHLFTKGSHYNEVTCIYLTRNLFPPEKYARTISLNTHYVVAFQNPRDAVGVRNLAQQAYPGRVPYVMNCFQDATSQPYGYLLFDLHPSTPDILRLRTNLLTQPTIVYQEHKNDTR